MTIEYDLSNDEYHNERPGYSSTFIKTAYLKSVYHAKNGSSSIALATADMGTAVHALTLEPEKELVRCGPETRRGNAWKEAYAEAEADGVTLLPEKEFYQAQDIAHSLLAHPEAKDILTADDKICEASIFVTHPELKLDLKIRPDIFVPSMGVMADVKTTQSSVPSQFARQVFSYGWHIQGAFYKLCAELAGWEVDSFAFLSVEKERPIPRTFITCRQSSSITALTSLRQPWSKLRIASSRKNGPQIGGHCSHRASWLDDTTTRTGGNLNV